MGRAKDSGSKLSPLANRKQMAYQGILLLKVEKQNAFNRQRNGVGKKSHSQSTTLIFSFFFWKRAAMAAGCLSLSLPAFTIHARFSSLSRPISGEQVGGGWPWALLHHPPRPTSPAPHPPTCVTHSAQGQLQPSWRHFCLLPSDQPIKECRCHPPLEQRQIANCPASMGTC